MSLTLQPEEVRDAAALIRPLLKGCRKSVLESASKKDLTTLGKMVLLTVLGKRNVPVKLMARLRASRRRAALVKPFKKVSVLKQTLKSADLLRHYLKSNFPVLRPVVRLFVKEAKHGGAGGGIVGCV